MGIMVIASITAMLVWKYLQAQRGRDIASANGRIEATEINVAAKCAGRIAKEFVDEGDYVTKGEVVAKMDTDVLQAQQREAKAKVQEAQSTIASKRSKLVENESKKAAAQATVMQREAELWTARQRSKRTSVLAGKAAVSQQEADDDKARVEASEAAVSAAKAQLAAADAAIATARSEVLEAQSSYEAAKATVQRIQADIDDSDLKAPRDGRVAVPGGPTIGSGCGRRPGAEHDRFKRCLYDLFLAHQGGRADHDGFRSADCVGCRTGTCDSGKGDLVADVAQFTPKTVETASEREKLMFRFKAHIPADLLRAHVKKVKTGLPGMAYVRLDPQAPWPDNLKVRLPNE